MQRLTEAYDALMNPAPIIRALAREDIVNPLAGDFLAIDIPQPRAREPERCLIEAVPNVDQSKMREELRHFQRIKIGSCRHAPRAGRAKPIVKEIALSSRHQLRPKGSSGHRHPPPWGLWPRANHRDMVRLCAARPRLARRERRIH